MKRRFLKFMAPEGDAGGGSAAAVAEAPEPMTPVGELYTQALNKNKAIEPAPTKAEPSGATGPAATVPSSTGPAATGAPAASGATGASEPAKPASALDAALEGIPATGATGATGPTPTEDYLKDIPEVLPKEGRKDHWEKARGAISNLGKVVGQKDQIIAERDRTIETLKATPPQTVERVTALEKENADLRDAITGINVEFDPEHRKKFIDGRKDIVSKAANKAHAFGGDTEGITKAMEMPEGRGRSAAIKEALSNVEDEYDRGRVLDLIKDVARLDDEKAELMKDPQGAWAKLQESEKTRITEASKKQEAYKQEVFETESKRLSAEIFLLREVDPSLPGAPEHNAQAKTMREAAFKLLGPDAKPADLVSAAYWKQAGPKTQELLATTRKELATALGVIKKYDQADPGFRGEKGPKKTPTEAALDESPGEIYKRSLRGDRDE